MQPALLFDMDGTLVDSEPIWHREMLRFAREHRARWTIEDCHATTGKPMTEWAAAMQSRGVELAPAEMLSIIAGRVADIVADDVPWLPGSLALLEAVATAGVPAALVTNATLVNAAAVLADAPSGALRFAVTCEDVTASKPDPEPYRTAAERLGADPARSIAFEDSRSGATAALAAGLRLWFLTTQLPEAPVPAGRTIATLADVSPSALLAALAG